MISKWAKFGGTVFRVPGNPYSDEGYSESTLEDGQSCSLKDFERNGDFTPTTNQLGSELREPPTDYLRLASSRSGFSPVDRMAPTRRRCVDNGGRYSQLNLSTEASLAPDSQLTAHQFSALL